MDKKKTVDFVDKLMAHVFSRPAPAMPDFSSIVRDESPLQALKDEDLDFLAAAGVSRNDEQWRKQKKEQH